MLFELESTITKVIFLKVKRIETYNEKPVCNILKEQISILVADRKFIARSV
jgi:hypothetical protein